MSLINQMLQELDARGTNAAPAGMMQGQVRVVPDRHDTRPLIWALIAVLVMAGLGAGIWWWQARPAAVQIAHEPKPVIQAAEFSLKIAPELSLVPLPDVRMPSVPAVAEMPQAAQPTPSGLPTVSVSAEQKKEPAPRPEPIARTELVPPSGAVAVPMLQPVAAPEAPVALSRKTQTPDVKAGESGIPPLLTKQVKELSAQQKAENAYRSGATLIQQGKGQEAMAMLEQALQFDANHAGARQALVALLIDSKRKDEAIKRLREGLQLDASQAGFAMILARLQVDRGETGAAIDTLQKSLPYSERTEHAAFLAALLQRESRHKEAIDQYRSALSKSPQNGVWWMGMGISLQAENRTGEAIDAYTHAKFSGSLSPELKAFVEEKLTLLQR